MKIDFLLKLWHNRFLFKEKKMTNPIKILKNV